VLAPQGIGVQVPSSAPILRITEIREGQPSPAGLSFCHCHGCSHSGKRFEWHVTYPDVHLSGDSGWLAYFNNGSMADASRQEIRQLEAGFSSTARSYRRRRGFARKLSATRRCNSRTNQLMHQVFRKWPMVLDTANELSESSRARIPATVSLLLAGTHHVSRFLLGGLRRLLGLIGRPGESETRIVRSCPFLRGDLLGTLLLGAKLRLAVPRCP